MAISNPIQYMTNLLNDTDYDVFNDKLKVKSIIELLGVNDVKLFVKSGLADYVMSFDVSFLEYDKKRKLNYAQLTLNTRNNLFETNWVPVLEIRVYFNSSNPSAGSYELENSEIIDACWYCNNKEVSFAQYHKMYLDAFKAEIMSNPYFIMGLPISDY